MSLLNLISRFKINSKKDYKLLEKTVDDISNFASKSWKIPEEAKKFTRVEIGKASDPKYKREIVTFYNDQGLIIKRCFKGGDSPASIRTYTYGSDLTPDLKYIETRKIITKQYQKSDEKAKKPVWIQVSEEDQHIHHLWNNRKGNNHSKKFTRLKKEYDLETMEPSKVTITEFPANLGLESKKDKKELSVKLKMKRDGNILIPKVKKISAQGDIVAPKKDKYLAYRFMTGKNKQESLAKYFIDEKELYRADIKIGTSEEKVSDGANACFKNLNGEIWFSGVVKNPVNTAAHEVEHAYQYSMIGRANFGRSDYEKRCRSVCGPITHPYERYEARQYANASLSYPATIVEKDGTVNPLYWSNLLEVKAREAGAKAQKEYDNETDVLLKQFKYIPQKYI